jgi:two-component system chemotaxis response regulator CheB
VKRVRVLVVDDSATSRLLLVEILRADEAIEVVGQAADGLEALEMVKRLSPDIVTMDVQMPRLDGFAATKRIMVEAPTPILIITSIDAHALSISLEAIRAGALAVQAKPGDPSAPGFEEEARELVRQVKAMSEVKVVRHHRQAAQTPAPGRRPGRRCRRGAAAVGGVPARRARGSRRHRRLHGRTSGPSPHPDAAHR